MQRHATAAKHTLLVLGVFVAAVVPAVAQTSTVIEREVREELRRDRDLRRLEVTVVGGEVTLRGALKTFWSKSEAIRRSLTVDGVELVVSEMEIPSAESDQKLANEVGKAVQRYPYYTVFDYLDGRINAGVITLIGKVTAERDKAGEIFERVAKIPGVQDVKNQIETITPSSADDNLRRTIARVVFASSHFQQFSSRANPPFHIVVERSVVTLLGYVQSEIERREMEQLARQTTGVLRVVNLLQTP
jgi:osmotically-inducible protein OsmY